MDARPPLSAALGAFGLAAVVTPPTGPSVETTVVWLPPQTVDVPVGGEMRRAEARRVMVLPLEDVIACPRGTVVQVPEFSGAETLSWRVDETDRIDGDHFRVVVVPV